MPGFVDEAQIHVKAGDGGAGAVSFRREAHVARGGPDGGDGGRGGDVILEASRGVVSLLAFKDHPHRRGGDGTHGRGGRKHGKRGAELTVPVPEGTVVRGEGGEVLADLIAAGDRLIAGEGGRGGRGNASFGSNRLRAPAFAEQGELGEERWLDLELKLMADVALVGFPNAGKSTLISRISAARPKIADYPFTTLEPHLGVVSVEPGSASARSPAAVTDFVVADVPGLVEGASEGRGLGHRFLRHIERARVLAILVDLAPHEGRPIGYQLDVLFRELGRHEPGLLARPRLVVGSRLDMRPPAEAPELAVELAAAADACGGVEAGAIVVSAVTGSGVTELVGRLAELVGEARAVELAEAGESRRAPAVLRPEPEGVSVERVDGELVVSGRAAERAVALSDLTDAAALEVVRRRLRRLGVDRALARAGAREGDPVRVGSMRFTYQSDT